MYRSMRPFFLKIEILFRRVLYFMMQDLPSTSKPSKSLYVTGLPSTLFMYCIRHIITSSKLFVVPHLRSRDSYVVAILEDLA